MPAVKKFVAGKFVWRNGKLEEVDPKEAIHLPVLSQALDYSRTAISGIRITPHFRDAETLLIFCLEDHLQRLLDSCQKLGFEPSATFSDLYSAAIEVVRHNWDLLKGGGYMRAVAYDPRSLVSPQTQGPVEIIIFAGQFGEYLPSGDLRLTFDDILRTGNQGAAKAAANYLGFAQAKRRAQILKVEDVIGITTGLLGRLVIGEGTTSNLFLVIDGKILTAPLEAGVLAGVTRARVIQIARDLGYWVGEKENVGVSLVPLAREIFLTGTASYVASATHLGVHPLETTVGQKINHVLRDAIAGKILQYQDWNTPVEIAK